MGGVYFLLYIHRLILSSNFFLLSSNFFLLSSNFFSSRATSSQASSFHLKQLLFQSSNFFFSQHLRVSNLLVQMLGTNGTLVHYTKTLTHYTLILSSKPCVNSADNTMHAVTTLQTRTHLGLLTTLGLVPLLYSTITGICSAGS